MRDISNKEKYVEFFQDKLSKAKVLVLSSCEGVTVDQMTALRKNIRQTGDEIRVVKNTLVKRALHNLNIKDLDKYMEGSTAVTFGYSDPVAPVKTLFDFAGKAQKFVFKAGFMQEKLLSVKELETLSKLPGRTQLLSMLLSTMVGPIRNMLSVCQGPIRKLVYALQAIKEKKEKAGQAG